MNSEVAYVQNGRKVAWADVTTEDLRQTIEIYPLSAAAQYALSEWARRFGKSYYEDN